MNKLLLIFLLLLIVFSSCDGRNTKAESIKESVTKFKKTTEPVNIVKYYPEGYVEFKTDTILNNDFHINIKTYVNMKDSISNSYRVDSTTTIKDVFRKWISEIKVRKDDKLIFIETIDLEFFYKNGTIKKENLVNSISNVVKVNQELSSSDSLYLTAELIDIYPKEYLHHFYNIIIDSKGNYSINKWRTIKNLIKKNART